MGEHVIRLSEEGEKLLDLVVEDVNSKVKPEDRADKELWLQRVIRDWIKGRIYQMRLVETQNEIKKEIDNLPILENPEPKKEQEESKEGDSNAGKE